MVNTEHTVSTEHVVHCRSGRSTSSVVAPYPNSAVVATSVEHEHSGLRPSVVARLSARSTVDGATMLASTHLIHTTTQFVANMHPFIFGAQSFIFA